MRGPHSLLRDYLPLLEDLIATDANYHQSSVGTTEHLDLLSIFNLPAARIAYFWDKAIPPITLGNHSPIPYIFARFCKIPKFGKLQLKTEGEQQVWTDCGRLVANSIIFMVHCSCRKYCVFKQKKGSSRQPEQLRRFH